MDKVGAAAGADPTLNYVIWLCCGAGCNRCYMGDIVKGVVYHFTAQLCYVGCVCDAMNMPLLLGIQIAGKELPWLATKEACLEELGGMAR